MGPSARGGPRTMGMLAPSDPTDPEVPAAKRLRAVRRKRTVVVAGAAVGALLFAILMLLYRMGQQVTTARPGPVSPATAATPAVVAPEDLAKEAAHGIPSSAARADELSEPAAAAPSTVAPPSASQRVAPAATEPAPATPKPPTNREIFRRPTF